MFSIAAMARENSENNFTIIPIVGFERVQRLLPTATMSTRFIYGAEALYQIPFTTLEAEYTHSQDNAADLATQSNYKFSDDKIKLGIRESANLGSYVSSYIRGGAQVGQSTTTNSTSSGTTTNTTKSKMNPYVGAGIGLHVMQYFSLNASLTCVYVPTSNPALSPYEFEPSIGFSIGF